MPQPAADDASLPACVLVGYDASEAADSVLAKALARLRGHSTRLVLAYAEPPHVVWCAGGMTVPASCNGWSQTDCVRTLAEIRMLGEDVTWQFTSGIGAPAVILGRAARTVGAEAIVVGRTRRRWGRSFSVAARLARSAPAPVHVV